MTGRFRSTVPSFLFLLHRRRQWAGRAALVAALACCAGVAWGAPRAVTARYQVGYNSFTAQGRMQVTPRGNGRWSVSLDIGNVLASMQQATVFDVQDGRLRPLGNSRVTTTPLTHRTIVGRFDWHAGRWALGGDAKPSQRRPVVLQAGDLDPLLLELALVEDVRTGRPTRYRVLENGRARLLDYRRLAPETVVVDGHARKAVKLFASEGRKRYVAWIVPDLPVPVRLLQSEPGGDTIDMRLTALH
jgi:hypothetical protein